MRRFIPSIFYFCAVILLAITIPAFSQVIYNAPATVRWDASESPGVDRYMVTIIRDVTRERWNYGTDGLRLTLPRPKSGVYVVEVRAGRVGSDGVLRWSEPCMSLNPACAKLRDGNPGAWKVRWKVSAPLGPLIIY